MKLTSKQIQKLKTKLALAGTGSRGKLAKTLNLHGSQITLACKTGFVPEHAKKGMREWLNL